MVLPWGVSSVVQTQWVDLATEAWNSYVSDDLDSQILCYDTCTHRLHSILYSRSYDQHIEITSIHQHSVTSACKGRSYSHIDATRSQLQRAHDSQPEYRPVTRSFDDIRGGPNSMREEPIRCACFYNSEWAY